MRHLDNLALFLLLAGVASCLAGLLAPSIVVGLTGCATIMVGAAVLITVRSYKP